MSDYWARYARQRLSRRAFVRHGAALGVGVAGWALAACGGSGTSETRDAAPGAQATADMSKAKPGGSIRAADPTLQPFATMDPLQNSYLGTYVMIENLKDAALVEFDEKLQITPALASRWEILPDGTEYTFTLVEGATFQDGSPINSEAVKWNIERRKATNPKHPPGVSPPYVLPERIEAIDARTVRLVFKTPYPNALQDLTYIGSLGPMISMKAHASPPGDPYGYETGADARPITPGAFKVDNFAVKESVTLSRFDSYFGGKSFLDKVEFRAVPEDGTRVTLLKTGEAQIVANIPPQDVDGLKADPNIVVDSRPGQKVLDLKTNLQKAPFGPYEDDRAIKFRQAVLYGIDREAIVKVLLKGQGSVADSLLLPSQFGYAATKKYPYDPKRARELLAQAGWDSSYEVLLHVGEGFATAATQIAQAIQANLKQIGMEVKLQVWGDFGALQKLAASADPAQIRQWDFHYSSWSMLPEPEVRIYGILHTDPKQNNGRPSPNSSPTLDALLEKMLSTPDKEERKRQLAEIQAIGMEKLPYIPLYYQYYTQAWRKNLKGVVVQNTESFDLRRAWLEQ